MDTDHLQMAFVQDRDIQEVDDFASHLAAKHEAQFAKLLMAQTEDGGKKKAATRKKELTPTLLREFVEKIVVHEAVALDGKCRGKQRTQAIEIYNSFVGKVDLPQN